MPVGTLLVRGDGALLGVIVLAGVRRLGDGVRELGEVHADDLEGRHAAALVDRGRIDAALDIAFEGLRG